MLLYDHGNRRLIRDRKSRTFTSTFTQHLSSVGLVYSKHGASNGPQKPKGVLGTGRRGYGGGGRGRLDTYRLHCHHLNDFCIKMGSDESHLNVS